MDLAEIDLESKAAEGVEVKLVHPGTGKVLDTGDGPVIITIVGRDSDKWNKASKKVSTELSKSYRGKIPREEVEASLRKVLAICTVSWTDNVEYQGEPLECTYENCLKLYSERKWIGEQLLEAAGDRSQLFLE